MKRNAMPMALFAAGVLAQAPADTTTITYSVCPTATTTTITLPTTITYCPGGFCNVTPPVGPTVTATATTTTTRYITVYPAPCPYGKKGMCDASYTITEDCPCTDHHNGYIPKDFTTTLHKCDSCGDDDGPTTYTRTMPCTTGAYATVTPSWGGKWQPGPHPEIPIEDDETDGSNGPKGGKPGAPVADAEAGGKPAGGKPAGGAPGAPVADAEAGGKPAGGAPGAPVADAEAGGKPAGGAPAGGAPAGAAPVADAQTGGKPAGGAPAGGAPVADAQAGGKPAGGAPVADASASPAAGSDAAGVKDYQGSASKAAFALSTVFAGVVGALALML